MSVTRVLGSEDIARTEDFATFGTGQPRWKPRRDHPLESLCFFIPIIDVAIKARKASQAPGTGTIVINPINALANSQAGEPRRYLGESYPHTRPLYDTPRRERLKNASASRTIHRTSP